MRAALFSQLPSGAMCLALRLRSGGLDRARDDLAIKMLHQASDNRKTLQLALRPGDEFVLRLTGNGLRRCALHFTQLNLQVDRAAKAFRKRLAYFDYMHGLSENFDAHTQPEIQAFALVFAGQQLTLLGHHARHTGQGQEGRKGRPVTIERTDGDESRGRRKIPGGRCSRDWRRSLFSLKTCIRRQL